MFFKNTPQFWMNLQSICELNRAKEYFKNNPIAISSYINFIKKDKKKLA
jgi:plasmid maintenance system antidote protein VapI